MADFGNYVVAEVMLWLMYVALAAALVMVAVSTVHSLRNRGESVGQSNRVSRRLIARIVAAGTAVVLAVACLLGSAQPLIINGISYDDRFWLKTTDGLIVASAVMMLVAALIVAYGLSGLNRKIKP